MDIGIAASELNLQLMQLPEMEGVITLRMDR